MKNRAFAPCGIILYLSLIESWLRRILACSTTYRDLFALELTWLQSQLQFVYLLYRMLFQNVLSYLMDDDKVVFFWSQEYSLEYS